MVVDFDTVLIQVYLKMFIVYYIAKPNLVFYIKFKNQVSYSDRNTTFAICEKITQPEDLCCK